LPSTGKVLVSMLAGSLLGAFAAQVLPRLLFVVPLLALFALATAHALGPASVFGAWKNLAGHVGLV